MRRRLVFTLVAAVCAAHAQAQSMSPMRGRVESASDEFALKVYPRNVYDRAIRFDMRVYDSDFRPVEALIMPEHFSLPANGVRPVTVVVPFAGQAERKVRVCAESVPFPESGARIRTRICGKFLAQRSF